MMRARAIFRDREQAGRVLAGLLTEYAHRANVLVLGLPRGGVPVAYEIAAALEAPLDVFIVRKLGVPGHEELAMGAIASGGTRVLNTDVLEHLQIHERFIEAAVAREHAELERRELVYRGQRPFPALEDRTVILVDDGLATGSTMRAAVHAVKAKHPARVAVAVPVASAEACGDMRREADDVVCAATPDPFYGVGLWYENFSQTSDDEVRSLLARAGFARDAA
jgi:putative phosphoribosyl transferase